MNFETSRKRISDLMYEIAEQKKVISKAQSAIHRNEQEIKGLLIECNEGYFLKPNYNKLSRELGMPTIEVLSIDTPITVHE